MQNKPLFVVAGGSGGHMLPALQWVKTWHQANPNCPIILFTGSSALEQSIALKQPHVTEIKTFSIAKFSARALWRYPKIAVQVGAAIIKSFYYVLRHRPTQVISTGGLLTIPMALAARMTGCSVYIHELNVVPGKAVLFLLPLTTKLYVCFEKTKDYCHLLGKDFSSKCEFKNYPVRFTLDDKKIAQEQIIASINALKLIASPPSAHGEPVEPHERSYPSTLRLSSGQASSPEGPLVLSPVEESGRAVLTHFDTAKKTILILGGSQGSVGLNKLFKTCITANPSLKDQIQIIHQTGAKDAQGWDEFYREAHIPALTFGFSDHIGRYYALADVIISRAGAGSLFETLFFEKPCIVVPLVTASTSHQVDNARELARVHPHLFSLVNQQEAVNDPSIFDNALREKINR